jgi:hypothetical protein
MAGKTKVGIVIRDRCRTCAGGEWLRAHKALGTWQGASWKTRLAPTMADAALREAYD